MCMCCASGVVDIEAETPRGTCTYVYMDESCTRGHHLSKDFCTPVNDLCRGSQEGKFSGRTHPLSQCPKRLQLLFIVTTD